MGIKDIGLISARFYILAWLLLPNFVLLYVYNESLPSLVTFLAVLAVTSLIYFYIFPSIKWFGLFNIPFALFSGSYAAYIYVYKSIPYEGMWFSIWDMVYLELIELGRYYSDLIILNLSGFILYVVCVLSVGRLKNPRRAHQKPVLLAGLVVILTTAVGQNFYSDQVDMGGQGFENSFIQSYPLGMAVQAFSTWNESKRHDDAIQISSIPELERTSAPLAEKEIYILVIGETARSDRWMADIQSNEYDGISSDNTVVFSDAYSQANFSDGSLHLLMTGASTFLEAKGTDTLPLISKAASCQTIWISNNKAYRYAWQTDYSVITEQTTSTPLLKRFDHAMLPAVYRAIKQSEQRACLIIHLLGSHFSYNQRYSHEFMQKTVIMSDYNDKTSKGHVTALRNAYDNSIHATNDFLNQVINVVKKQSATSFVLYTSDHGENIYDDERGLFQHIIRTPSRYEVAVPFFVWGSDLFISNFPKKWSNLVKNSNRPISNKQVLPTFVDLLDVHYEKSHFSASLLSDYSIDPPRFVLAPDMRLLTEAEIK
jgi:glucan phosphoethanolaminetransferase (alkaline phosphatase superfamily)